MTILIQYSPAWVNPNLSSGAAWALLLTRGQRYGRGRWCLPPWAAAYLGAGCTSLPALGRNHDRRYDSHLILVASGQPHQPGWGRWRRQNVLTCPSHRTPPPRRRCWASSYTGGHVGQGWPPSVRGHEACTWDTALYALPINGGVLGILSTTI